MKSIKNVTQKESRCISDIKGRLNKMGDFIRYLIKGMTKEAIELTCAVVVNILKYVSGVQGVDETVNIGPANLTFLLDRLKTKRMCNETVRREPFSLMDVPDYFKREEMCLETVHKNLYMLDMSQTDLRPRRYVIRQSRRTLLLCNMFLSTL